MSVQSRRDSNSETITVSKDGQWYVAKDESTGIASQGETKAEALENLAEALELHNRPEPDRSDEDGDPATAPWLD